jgi:hypothetical protein
MDVQFGCERIDATLDVAHVDELTVAGDSTIGLAATRTATGVLRLAARRSLGLAADLAVKLSFPFAGPFAASLALTLAGSRLTRTARLALTAAS